jgi:RES domain-containing protein
MASRSDSLTAWRIVKRRYSAAAFDGEGARRFGGRWNNPGTPIVYVSESRALALLEVLTGLRSVTPLPAYVMIPVSFSRDLVKTVRTEDLPSGWRESPPLAEVQRIGDRWAGHRESAILRVPSAIVPDEYNYLLNPNHPAFNEITVGQPQQVSIDPRLVR